MLLGLALCLLQVLRRLLDQHGGHEVCTNGDSFTFAFHDAADAVAYCIRVSVAKLQASCNKRTCSRRLQLVQQHMPLMPFWDD